MKRNIARTVLFIFVLMYAGEVFTEAPDPVLLVGLLFGYALLVAVDVLLQHRRGKGSRAGAVFSTSLVLFSVLLGGLELRNLRRDPNYALRVAVADGYSRMALWSIQHGADVNGTPNNRRGRPSQLPLEVAIIWNRPSSVRLLLQLGADPNRLDAHGDPIALIAAANSHGEILLDLWQHGMDVNARSTSSGSAALHEAISSHREPALRFLVEHGANVNLQDDRGETALMKAACNDSPDAASWVDLLLRNGADRTIKNKSGQTAFDLAKACNAAKAAELLSR